MRRIVAVLSMGAVLMAVSACQSNTLSVSGGENSPLITTKGMTAGNWYFVATSQVVASRVTNFSGPLTSSNSTVSVTTTPGSVCLPAFSPVVFSGTVSDNSVTLTSPPISASSRVMTISGTAGYGTNLDGTYQIQAASSLDACNGDMGTVQGLLVPSLSASWSGTVVESAYDANGNPIVDGLKNPVTNTASLAATIVQAATPVTIKSPVFGTIDVFALSGTVTFTNSPCYNSGAIDSTQSYIVGSRYLLSVKTDTGGTITASGTLDPTRATAIRLTYTVSSGVCNYYQVTGTLTNP